jgi:hypothetical protein
MAAVLSRAMRDSDEEQRLRPTDAHLLGLAHALTGLLAHANEFCTPGHRMGAGYRLLLTAYSHETSASDWPATARVVSRRLA